MAATREDFDVIKVSPENSYSIGPTDGNQQAWNELYLTCKAGITNDAVYRKLWGRIQMERLIPPIKTLIDPDNLIDYMMVIYFGGNLDAPISWFLGEDSPNNFYGMRDRTGKSGGFKFFAHDAEHTLLDVNEGPHRAIPGRKPGRVEEQSTVFLPTTDRQHGSSGCASPTGCTGISSMMAS